MMDRLPITAELLTAAAFAPFGDVLSTLDAPGRLAPAADIQNLRAWAKPVLGVSRVAAAAGPFLIQRVERHLYSSQTFIPMGGAGFLVVVAAADPATPTPDGFRAFFAVHGQGISYAPGTWHHPLLAIGGAADFATLIWRADDDGDEQFAEIAPFEVLLPI